MALINDRRLRGLVRQAVSTLEEVMMYARKDSDRLAAAKEVLDIEGYAANGRRVGGSVTTAPMVINIGAAIPWAPSGQVISGQVVQGALPSVAVPQDKEPSK